MFVSSAHLYIQHNALNVVQPCNYHCLGCLAEARSYWWWWLLNAEDDYNEGHDEYDELKPVENDDDDDDDDDESARNNDDDDTKPALNDEDDKEQAINDDDDDDDDDKEGAENDAVNLIHQIKQGRNVCYPRIKPPNEGRVIWTSFSHAILIFSEQN